MHGLTVSFWYLRKVLTMPINAYVYLAAGAAGVVFEEGRIQPAIRLLLQVVHAESCQHSPLCLHNFI
jgi:hypothetical protein